MDDWPIAFADVEAAAARLRSHLAPTPLRRYPLLEAAVGHDIAVWVKRENHQPTNAFKVRNAVAALTLLDGDGRRRGVIGATRGNHGQGLAWAGHQLGIPVTVCVPHGNNPDKNAAVRGWGARLVEAGADYDESVAVARELAAREGLHLVHSTNDRGVLAGAATLTLEMLAAAPDLDAVVLAVGGGSQAVGALTVARALKPGLEVYAVQAAGAPAMHDSWHAGAPRPAARALTFADGLATREPYALTFAALRAGLADFVLASEAELAAALRLVLATTHNLVEGAGAAGLAGLMQLRPRFTGRRVGIVLSGGNIDVATLRQVLADG